MTPWSSFWHGPVEFEYALRILLSCVCGLLIGLERTKRQKEAGVRTHVLVAMGAALIMVVSKYGFFDILALDTPRLDVDAARMGSTILTAISFLGAGMILQKGGAVRGLTTAAGIWVTAGVGIAIGAGMYALGVACAILIMFIQTVLKRAFSRIDDPADNALTVRLADGPDAVRDLIAWLDAQKLPAHIGRLERQDGKLTLTLLLGDHAYAHAAETLAQCPTVEFVSL